MRLGIAVFCAIFSISALARAGVEEFVGWSHDGSYYATCSGGFDGNWAECDVCLTDAGAGSNSWPKDVAKPQAGASCVDGCAFDDGTDLSTCDALEAKLAKTLEHHKAKSVSATVRSVRDRLVVTARLANGRTAELGVDREGPPTKWAIDATDALPDGSAAAFHLEQAGSGPSEDNDLIPSRVVVFTKTTLAQAKAHADAQAANVAGMKLYQKKDWPDAVKSFRAAIAAEPTYVLPHYNLACTAALAGDRATAIDELTWLSKSDDEDAAERLKKAKTDRDLDSIRDDPAVRKLLSK